MIAIEKYRPRIRWLAGLVVLGALLTFVGSVAIPINGEGIFSDLRTTISQDFGSVSKLNGKAELRFLPHPSIEIAALKLSFDNKVSLEAPRISFNLSIPALIAGRYEPISSTLVSPHVVIPSDLLPNSAEQMAQRFNHVLDHKTQTGASRNESHLDSITIENGVFSFSEKNSTESPPSTISGTLYFYSNGARRLTATGNWRKQDVTLQAEIGANTNNENDDRKVGLVLSTALGSIKLDGATSRLTNALYAGALSVDVSRIDKVSEWLALQPPVPFTTSLKIEGKASMTPRLIAVSDAQVHLGAVAMTGGVSLDMSNPRPLVTGTLSAGDMDITSFLTPIWPKQSEQPGWKNSPVDPNVTPDQDLDIRLSAERINLGIVRISNAALSIIARDRNLNITLASSHLFQGSAKGKLSIHPTDQGFSFSSHASFETLDIGQTTLALMDMRKLEGSLSGKFDIESAGQSIDDMMKSLSGRAEFSIANGTLSGVNISTILKRIETRPLSVIRDMRGGKTDFETMRISCHIANGIATIDDSEMLFAPNTMKLSGSVAVGDRQINLLGEATGPTPQNGAEPAVLAYTVTGGFDDPIVTPDINRILKRSSGTSATPD